MFSKAFLDSEISALVEALVAKFLLPLYESAYPHVASVWVALFYHGIVYLGFCKVLVHLGLLSFADWIWLG
jgi:hypothetical protein